MSSPTQPAETSGARRRPGALRSLEVRNARIFFVGLWASNVGTWAHSTAVVLLIRSLGGGGRELGMAAFCQFAPLLLLGLFAGSVADRVDRLVALKILSIGLAVVVTVLGVLVTLDRATVPIVLAFTFVFGVVAAFENPTRRTFMTELVPPESVGNVLALSSSAMTSARLVGPAIAALIASTTTLGLAFLLNAVSYGALIVSLGLLDRSEFFVLERGPASATPVRDGLAAVWVTTELRVVIVVFAVISTVAFNHRVAFPLLVSDQLDRPDSFYGWMLSAMSVGSVFGGLVVGRLDVVRGRLVMVAGVAVGVALAGVALATRVAVVLPLAVVLGLAMSSFSNCSTVYLQQHTDPAMRSRVLALTSVLFIGSTPIGGPITGVVGDAFGAVWASLYGAIVSVAIGSLGFMVLLRSSARVPTTTGDEA